MIKRKTKDGVLKLEYYYNEYDEMIVTITNLINNKYFESKFDEGFTYKYRNNPFEVSDEKIYKNLGLDEEYKNLQYLLDYIRRLNVGKGYCIICGEEHYSQSCFMDFGEKLKFCNYCHNEHGYFNCKEKLEKILFKEKCNLCRKKLF